MRSSCQTGLANKFPAHVVYQWLGNSEIVAKEHYLQVTEEHFQSACSPSKNLGQQASEARNEKNPEIVGFNLNHRGLQYTTNGRNRTRNLVHTVGDSSNFSQRGLKSVINTADSSPELINGDYRPHDAVLEKIITHSHLLPNQARLLIGDILDKNVKS